MEITRILESGIRLGKWRRVSRHLPFSSRSCTLLLLFILPEVYSVVLRPGYTSWPDYRKLLQGMAAFVTVRVA